MKEGAKVVCADINLVTAEKTVESIVKLVGSSDSAVAFKVDVSKESEVKDLVEQTVSKFGNFLFIFFLIRTGKLDIMFNNAGIMHSEDDNALNTSEKIW